MCCYWSPAEVSQAHVLDCGYARAWSCAQAFLYNPGNVGTPTQLSWAALTGQNFSAEHASPHIDFCAAHIWPDRWVRTHWHKQPMAMCPCQHTDLLNLTLAWSAGSASVSQG